jgi:hypothetical protein
MPYSTLTTAPPIRRDPLSCPACGKDRDDKTGGITNQR